MMYQFNWKELLNVLEQYMNSKAGEVFFVRDFNGSLSTIATLDVLSESALKELHAAFGVWTGPRYDPSELEDLLDQIRQESEQFTINGTSVYCSDRMPHLANWFDKKQPKKSGSNIITFYSYKGGVGRSTLAAATALELSKSYRVILIDADIEAPGVSWYFYPRSNFGTDNPVTFSYGLVDYLNFYQLNALKKEESPISLSQFLFGNDQNYPNLWFLSAGNTVDAEAYVQAVSRLDFNSHSKQGLDHLINDLNHYCQPNFIIFDARTGLTDIGGLLTRKLADFSVFVGYPDDQSDAGLKFFARHLAVKTDQNSISPPQINALWVHSPAPKRDGLIDQVEHQKFINQIKSSLENMNPSGLGQEDFIDLATSPESGNILAVPHEEDLRALIRKDGIKVLQTKELLYREVKALAQRVLEFFPEVSRQELQQEILERGLPACLFKKVLDELQKGTPVDSYGETETLSTPEDVEINFYPLPEFRLVFQPTYFLILGKKGTGKTTLERVLGCFNSVKQEAFAKSITGSGNAPGFIKQWFTVLGTNTYNNFNRLANDFTLDVPGFERFWSVIMAASLNLGKPPSKADVELALEQAKTIANVEATRQLEDAIHKQNDLIFLIFDRLDDTFPDAEVRKNAIQALVNIWWRLINLPDLKVSAKIFYRKDLFDSDVSHPNKGHIKSRFSFSLDWKFLQIEAAMIKRLLQRSPSLAVLFERFFEEKLTKSPLLGYLPDSKNEAWLTDAIRLILGERVTQPYAEVWLNRYLRDGNDSFFPRFAFQFLALLVKESQPAAGAVFDTYRTIKKVYWDLTEGHLNNEFLEMYKELGPVCEKIKKTPEVKAIIKDRIEFERWLGDLCDSSDYKQDKSPSWPESGAEMLRLMMESGLIVPFEIGTPGQVKFPDMYRVPLKISVANGLPPR